MPRTLRTIVAGLMLILVTGCGSDSPAPLPDVVVAPEPPAPPPVVKPAHEMDPAKHAVPAGPVNGTVAAADFVAEAVIEGDYLIFRTPGTGATKVSLEVRTPGLAFENRKITVRQETPPGPEVPRIFVEAASMPRPDFYTNGYAMTLETGARKGGKLPGRVYLCFADEKATVLAGTFEADYPRMPTDPPGIEDVPFVNGSVALRNIGPKVDVRVGYLGVVGPDLFVLGAGEIDTDPDAPPGSRSTQFVYDKPRVTNLIAGDGKATPSRYEHSRLAPGRYLVFAAVPGGPIAWKWVTVADTTTTTVDFTLDPTQTGGVEVNTPLEALGKVHLVPVNDHPAAGVLDANTGFAIGLHLRLEQDIVARKALFKNLAPGKYEVRAGGQVRVVEIVAGKTVELDFDKKPPEAKKDGEAKKDSEPKK